MRLKSKTQKGSVLLAVVVVSMMMMVIVAAGISMVGHTQTRTNREYREKQAYFLASSSLRGFVSEVTRFGDSGSGTEAEAQANVEMLHNLIGKETKVDIKYNDGGSDIALKDVNQAGVYEKRLNYGFADENTCSCTIKVEKDGSEDSLKAIATADYLGEKATVVAYFSVNTPMASGALNNALEFIGKSGGAAGTYNNVTVLGNTGAVSTESHTNNILYKFYKNDSRFEGTTDILGSIMFATNTGISSNFKFKPGVDSVDEAGCVLEVSRSAIFAENTAYVRSAAQKKRDYSGKPTYNYINTGEALIAPGNYSTDATFCGSPDHEVDVYTGGLVAGGPLKNNQAYADSRTKKAFENSFTYSSLNPAGLTQKVLLEGSTYGDIYEYGNANGFAMYGNLYTFDSGDFKGDISFYNNDVYVYGDIYCYGNIYLYATRLHMNSDSKIHLMNGSKVFLSHGSTPYSIDNKPADGKIKGYPVEWDNWFETGKGGDRAKRPTPKTSQAQEYLHDPESFFMIDMDTNLDDEYKSMYKSSVPGSSDAMKLKDPGSRADGKIPYLSLDPAVYNPSAGIDGTAPLRNTSLKVIKDSKGKEYIPRFYITESFVLGTYDYNSDTSYGSAEYREKTKGDDNNIIYIDVEKAGHDICIILQDGKKFTMNHETKIVVHNKPDPDHYVYFCSDSGCGKVATTGTPAANYKTNVDYTTFRANPKYTFYPENRNYIYTDKLWDAFVTGNEKAYVPGDSAIYMFAGADSYIALNGHNNLIFEGSIYAPKADIEFILGLQNINIDYFSKSPQTYAVLGALMCRNWINDGNLSTIAYEQAAPNSLLPKIVNSTAKYDAGFKLNQYAAY